MKYITNTKSLIVRPEGEAIFSERATTVSVDDEAAGTFVVIEQFGRSDSGKVAIDPEEWPAIRDAVEAMLAECEKIDGDMAHHERIQQLGIDE